MNKLAIFHATSWYHFLGLCSYFEGKKYEAHEVTIVLVVGTFFQTKQSFPIEKLERYARKVILLDCYDAIYRSNCLQDADEILIMSARSLNLSLAMHVKKFCDAIKYVVLEEGIGTYADPIKSFISFANEQSRQFGKAKWVYFMQYGLINIAKSLIKRLMFSSIPEELWLNFDKSTLTVNDKVVSSYKSALLHLCRELQHNIFLLPIPGSILITSPFSELGLVEEAEFNKKLQKFIDTQKREIKTMYIKPHPIQNLSPANAITLPKSIPIEKIIYHNQDKIGDIYSFSSTSCYTLPLFLNKRVIRIKDFDYFYSTFGEKQRAIIDRYTDTADDY